MNESIMQPILFVVFDKKIYCEMSAEDCGCTVVCQPRGFFLYVPSVGNEHANALDLDDFFRQLINCYENFYQREEKNVLAVLMRDPSRDAPAENIVSETVNHADGLSYWKCACRAREMIRNELANIFVSHRKSDKSCYTVGRSSEPCNGDILNDENIVQLNDSFWNALLHSRMKCRICSEKPELISLCCHSFYCKENWENSWDEGNCCEHCLDVNDFFGEAFLHDDEEEFC